MSFELKEIAHISTPFPEKFGVPRQSGLCSSVKGKIIFEPEFRDANAVRFLESFSHIWLIWGFDRVFGKDWSPTVRPPKLGGNERAGVFATRSPFRPNPIGLSCVKIEHIEFSEKGPVIEVSGVDMVDGTPIFDIKPYVPYTDCVPDASAGISHDASECKVSVDFECETSDDLKSALREILSQDPHPMYIDSPDRLFKMSFDGRSISFRVDENSITVVEVL